MKLKHLTIFLLTLVFQSGTHAQVRLPRLIRDSMILQRDRPLKIWGWARPDEKVAVIFNRKTHKTTTGHDGKWSLLLPAMKAGGPVTMKIQASNTIVLKEILIGDVWLCAGQSNMVHQLNIHDVTYAKDIEEANYSQIRQFWIPTLTNLENANDDLPTGFWKSAVGEDVRPFSAVAYFFAKKIYDQYHVPIGLINASVGGPPIEAWISEQGLKAFPGHTEVLQKNKDTAYITQRNIWARASEISPDLQNDKGLNAPVKWFDTAYVASRGAWKSFTVPGYWEDQGVKDLDGIVWFRKEVMVPASMTGKPARVFLGRIVDADVLYINGKQVGNTTYQYPQRRYRLANDVLKPGKNIFVVKVINTSGKGGFVPDKPYCVFAGNDTISLKGDWQYRVGAVFPPREIMDMDHRFAAQDQPTALYNGMIAPLINYTIKGMLWYQGEGNTHKPEEYKSLQPALIADWRNKWGLGTLPFLFVQLPNFMPSESQWAVLRESQLQSLSVPQTGMAVTIDLGEWNDLHPDNKKDVGERLALIAKKIAYGEDIEYSGPVFQSFVIDSNRIILSFTHTGTGLISRDGEPLREFAVAGADKKFVWANAEINGDKIVVWSDAVAKPEYVRYAWADNPEVNLYNREGLPASPFRTDPPAMNK